MDGRTGQALVVAELSAQRLGNIVATCALEARRLVCHRSEVALREVVSALREPVDFRVTASLRDPQRTLPVACSLVQTCHSTPEHALDQAARLHPDRLPRFREGNCPQQTNRRQGAEPAHGPPLTLALLLRQARTRLFRRATPAQLTLQAPFAIRLINSHRAPTFTKGLYAQVAEQYVMELYNKIIKNTIYTTRVTRNIVKSPRIVRKIVEYEECFECASGKISLVEIYSKKPAKNPR